MFYGQGCLARLGARFGDDITTLDGEPENVIQFPSVLVELWQHEEPGRLGTDEDAGGSSEVRRRGDVAHSRSGGLQLPRRHGACILPALEHPAAAAD
jgi:hypothetical protein